MHVRGGKGGRGGRGGHVPVDVEPTVVAETDASRKRAPEQDTYLQVIDGLREVGVPNRLDGGYLEPTIKDLENFVVSQNRIRNIARREQGTKYPHHIDAHDAGKIIQAIYDYLDAGGDPAALGGIHKEARNVPPPSSGSLHFDISDPHDTVWVTAPTRAPSSPPSLPSPLLRPLVERDEPRNVHEQIANLLYQMKSSEDSMSKHITDKTTTPNDVSDLRIALVQNEVAVITTILNHLISDEKTKTKQDFVSMKHLLDHVDGLRSEFEKKIGDQDKLFRDALKAQNEEIDQRFKAQEEGVDRRFVGFLNMRTVEMNEFRDKVREDIKQKNDDIVRSLTAHYDDVEKRLYNALDEKIKDGATREFEQLRRTWTDERAARQAAEQVRNRESLAVEMNRLAIEARDRRMEMERLAQALHRR